MLALNLSVNECVRFFAYLAFWTQQTVNKQCFKDIFVGSLGKGIKEETVGWFISDLRPEC